LVKPSEAYSCPSQGDISAAPFRRRWVDPAKIV
jgi:hypothetical protein